MRLGLRRTPLLISVIALTICHELPGSSLGAQQAPLPSRPPNGDSVTIRVINTELRAAVQIMGQYLDRPVVFSGPGNGQVTLDTPRPVARTDVIRLLRGLVESQNYDLVSDTAAGIYRIKPRDVARAEQQSMMQPARQPATIELFVVPLRHARAADVAATVNALYGRAMPSVEGRTGASTLTDELRANRLPPVGASAPSNVPGITGTPATLTGELTIVADARANSLLLRANRNDFEVIRTVVDQLDVPPLQVLIEALVVEARRDRSFNLGVEGTLDPTKVGHGKTQIAGSVTGPGLGDFAITVMGIGGVELQGTLRMAAERGDVHIMSRPIILTENNHEAEILIGSQRPFVQVQRALPTDAGVRDQVVQYKDVGTRLVVKPTISADGFVQLEVTQEVSNATGETQFNAPVISQRSIQTQLMIRDGQTIVLGGLTDRQKDASQGGLPILSAIPLIGGLFGHVSRQTTETELFVFLTPRVIHDEEDADLLTRPLRRRAQEIKP